jgi:hypothetical protein
MKAKDTQELKAEDIVNLLRRRFASHNGAYNRCVVLEQVPDGTGLVQNRWIDVAVFEMWPSKGLTRSAFEIKVSRSDFLRELNTPEKHKWCLDSFHEFWFVAPKGVIQLEELPKGIGWMYPRGEKLCIARHAIRNAKPVLSDELLAGFMRAAYKGIEAATKLTSESVLADSTEYKNTSLYREAILRFLQERGIPPPYEVTVENIYSKLVEATLDKQLKQDCDQLLAVSGTFQRTIANLATLFLVIAKRSLIARNEMGDYIVKAYNIRDEDSIEILKEMGKASKMSDYQKRYAEVIELLLNWESIANG